MITHLDRQQSSKFSAHLHDFCKKLLLNAGICHISRLAYHSKVVIIKFKIKAGDKIKCVSSSSDMLSLGFIMSVPSSLYWFITCGKGADRQPSSAVFLIFY